MLPLIVVLGVILCGQLSDQNKIDADGCGQRPLAPTVGHLAARIVGGEVSTPYSWPFMCTIEDLQLRAFICAGSLIKSKTGKYFIISVAHCLSHLVGHVNRVRARCSIHNVVLPDPRAVEVHISDIVIHPHFDQAFHNDVGLLHVAGDLNLTDSLQPACLPTEPHKQFEMATVLGWGVVAEGGMTSPELREGRKPVVQDADCSNAYGTEFAPSSMLCAGYLGTGGVDACALDSGGPLLAQRNGVYQIVGLVGWGYGCARPEYPGVYTDVYDMVQWLDSTINTFV